MANYFDQFDEPQTAGNYFDRFDDPPARSQAVAAPRPRKTAAKTFVGFEHMPGADGAPDTYKAPSGQYIRAEDMPRALADPQTLRSVLAAIPPEQQTSARKQWAAAAAEYQHENGGAVQGVDEHLRRIATNVPGVGSWLDEGVALGASALGRDSYANRMELERAKTDLAAKDPSWLGFSEKATGLVGGALGMPMANVMKGTTLLPSTVNAALTGGLYSAADASGAAENDRIASGFTGGALGTVLGGSIGAAANRLGPVLGWAGDKIKSITPENAALLRLRDLFAKDAKQGATLPVDEFATAAARGQPVMNLDIGGPRVLREARAAVDKSEDAEALLSGATRARFEDGAQGARIEGALTDISGMKGNATATLEDLGREARASRTPLYEKAYAKGAGGIDGDWIAALAQSPHMQTAMDDATKRMLTREAIAAADGATTTGIFAKPAGAGLAAEVPVGGVPVFNSAGAVTGHIGNIAQGSKAQDVLQFIRAKGGIRPDTELKAMNAEKLNGIVSKDGMHIDKMREALVEAGYLSEAGAHEVAVTTPQHVYDLISDAISGKRIVPQADEFADGLFQYASAARSARREELHQQRNVIIPEIEALDKEKGGTGLADAWKRLTRDEQQEVTYRTIHYDEPVDSLIGEMLVRPRPTPTAKPAATEDGPRTLEFWDQVKQHLDGKINAAIKNEDGPLALNLSQLRDRLVQGLDGEVPSYGAARGTAAQYFQTGNAVEAGQKFASPSGNYSNEGVKASLKTMTAQERTAFQEGYISRLVAQVREARTTGERNVAAELLNSTASRERAEMVLGAEKAAELRSFLVAEIRMHAGHKVLEGGSKTARLQNAAKQLGGGATIGGGLGWYYGDGERNAILAGMMAGAAGKQYRSNRMAEEMAKLLVSKDPSVISRALPGAPPSAGLARLSAMASEYAPAASIATNGMMAEAQR